jgi:tRNA(Arg) A34 adenosine deaminase TadA
MKFTRWLTAFFPAMMLWVADPAISAAATPAATVEAFPDDPACTADDRRFMARAYELARSSVAHGNHPFSALLVKDGKIIFEYENTIYSTHDLTQHAETGLIGKATQQFDPETLAACTLYASTEPCIMCCGAIRWAGIRRVVYGTTSSQLSRVVALTLPPKSPVVNPPPLLECREIFARTEPGVKVFGPLMEAEGIAIHLGYWPHDPVLLAILAKAKK